MSTPRIWDPASRSIWEALNSGNLQALTEVLQQVNFNTHPRDTARLLIENNQRRKTVKHEQEVIKGHETQLDRVTNLARELYFAISDVYEDVAACVDADLVGDAYRSNWAGNAIERWTPLLERAEAILGLVKDKL